MDSVKVKNFIILVLVIVDLALLRLAILPLTAFFTFSAMITWKSLKG